MTQERRMQMLLNMMTNCAMNEGASDTDVNLMMKNKAASTHAEKCIAACVGEESGMVRYFHFVI